MEYYILFQGAIDEQSSLAFINALLEADRKEEVNHITVLLSSVGGSVYHGFNIATVIRNLQKPVRIHASNEVSSIANIIYLSAQERSAESYAKFFLHGASTGSGSGLNIEDLNEHVSSIKVQNERLAKFIFESTGMALNDVKKLMRKRKSLSAEQASASGFVLEVKQEQIPAGAMRKNVIFV